MIEGENYAGFPHLCHRNPEVYAAMYRCARMLIEDLGFDGLSVRLCQGLRRVDDRAAGKVPIYEGRQGVTALRHG